MQLTLQTLQPFRDKNHEHLVRDFVEVGYSEGDARRLTDRVVCGELLPGLAMAPNSKTPHADATRCRARSGAGGMSAPLFETRESPVRVDRFYAGARRAPNSGAPLCDSHKPTREVER
jgi:hypothetical protein